MAARPLAARLTDFARRAEAAGTDLELHHGSRGLVARWDKGETWPGGDEIEAVAVDHAAALHGRQGYELRAVYPEGDSHVARARAMVAAFAPVWQYARDMGEPATEKGVIALLQRQNERLLTAIERSQKPVVDAVETLGRLWKAQLEHQDQLFRRELDMATLRLEGEEAAAKRAAEAERWRLLAGRFGPVADAIVARLVPGAAPKREEGLERLALSLTAEQRAAVFAFLDDDEKTLVVEQRWRELMLSVLHRHMDRLVAILDPAQLAILDAMAQGEKKAAE